MRKLSILERRENTIAILETLVNNLKTAVLNYDKNAKIILHEYRKAIRAAASEYNAFLSNLSRDANIGSKSAQRVLDDLVALEYVTYYDQPKGKHFLDAGKKAMYAGSLADLQNKTLNLIKLVHSFITYDELNTDSSKYPTSPSEVYLDGWSTDIGIVYAYGETGSGEMIGPESQQMQDGTTISHYQFTLETSQIINHNYGNLCIINQPLYKLLQDDYQSALDELKHKLQHNFPNEKHRPLVIKLKKLISQIELSYAESPNHPLPIEELTTILESTNQLIDKATTATPKELEAACANFQEKALQLDGAPSPMTKILSALLVCIGTALLAIAILAPINAPIAVGVISVGLIGMGGISFFNNLQKNHSKNTSDIADELIANPIKTM